MSFVYSLFPFNSFEKFLSEVFFTRFIGNFYHFIRYKRAVKQRPMANPEIFHFYFKSYLNEGTCEFFL